MVLAKTPQEEIAELRDEITKLASRKIKPGQIEIEPLRKKLAEQPIELAQVASPGSVVVSMFSEETIGQFLKLMQEQNLGLDIGTTTTSFVGGTQTSEITTVAHALGKVPLFIAIQPLASEASNVVFHGRPMEGTFTELQFKYRVFCSAATAAIPAFNSLWLAIG